MFTKRIDRIQPSATLEMTSKAAELKRNNKPVYNMSVGEPDFSTPQNIQEAGIYAIENGFTKYTPGSGTYDLKKAICEKLERDNGLLYDNENIVVSCGGSTLCIMHAKLFFRLEMKLLFLSPTGCLFLTLFQLQVQPLSL